MSPSDRVRAPPWPRSRTLSSLATAVTEVGVLEAYVDKAVLALTAGTLTAVDAAKAKLWAAEVQHRVLDRYPFGGWGYMTEYPIARVRRRPGADLCTAVRRRS